MDHMHLTCKSLPRRVEHEGGCLVLNFQAYFVILPIYQYGFKNYLLMKIPSFTNKLEVNATYTKK